MSQFQWQNDINFLEKPSNSSKYLEELSFISRIMSEILPERTQVFKIP